MYPQFHMQNQMINTYLIFANLALLYIVLLCSHRSSTELKYLSLSTKTSENFWVRERIEVLFLGIRVIFQRKTACWKKDHQKWVLLQICSDMAMVGRNVAAPLLFLNLIMYLIVVGFASWCLNRYINGQTNHPSFGGNGATMFFLIFSIMAGVVGIASKFAGGNHIRAWRNDSLAAAAASSLVAWALTALSFGLACKEINIGGHRGWRLRVLEAFIIILTFTQLLYVLLIHAGVFSSRYGPGYRESDYGVGAPGMDPAPKGHTAVTGSRV